MAVTRADVARRAGVSPALVSYVINGGPRPVSEQARRRIEAAIEALGYRPNAIASALRGGMTRTIGLLIPSPANPFFAEMAEAFVVELSRRGNTLSIGITDDNPDREALYVRSFIDRRVDGLVTASSRVARTVERTATDTLPMVVVDRVEERLTERLSSVHMDNPRMAMLAVEHLQAHGHTRIGCIAGPWPLVVSDDRVAGWRAQQQQVGADAGDAWVEHAEFTAAGGRDAAYAMLGPRARRGRQRPTALLVTSDVQAIGVLTACAELGLRVPDDVAIVAVDGTAAARYTQPPLTTIRQPLTEMVRTAVGHLLDTIADPSSEPAHTVLEGNLVIGSSCGCAVGGGQPSSSR